MRPEPSIWSDTPHLVVRLRELAAQRKSGAQIARVLKVSRSAVIGKANRLGIRLSGMAYGRNAGVEARAAHADLQHFARPSSPRSFSWETEPRRAL
jgi:hypothetical protein